MPSFIFYESFYEALREVDDAIRLEVYDAICKYAIDDIDPTLTGVAKALFALIKPQLDANKKRRDDGSRGGRPSAKPSTTTKSEQAKPAVIDCAEEAEPVVTETDAKNKPNANVNVNANANVNAKEIPPKSPKGDAPEDGFDAFWAAYPKHDAKAVANKSWLKLQPNDKTRSAIHTDIERRRRSPDWLKDGGKYIPMPATYLNQRRWEDEGTAIIPDYTDIGRYQNMDFMGFREAGTDGGD